MSKKVVFISLLVILFASIYTAKTVFSNGCDGFEGAASGTKYVQTKVNSLIHGSSNLWAYFFHKASNGGSISVNGTDYGVMTHNSSTVGSYSTFWSLASGSTRTNSTSINGSRTVEGVHILFGYVTCFMGGSEPISCCSQKTNTNQTD